MVQITGVLTTPTGTPVVDTQVRVRAVSTVTVMLGAEESIFTGSDGSYDFNLKPGMYSIEVKFIPRKFYLSGVVQIDGTEPAPLTLEQLISDYAVCTPSVPDCGN